MAYPNRIGRLRNGQGLTTTQLGAICEVHENTVRRWEQGATPLPQKYWAQLSELFGVSVAYLLGLSDDNGDGVEQAA